MNKETNIEDTRETNQLAKRLSEAIVRSDEYIRYRKYLEELQKDPELYAEVNNLRKKNFVMQNGGEQRMTYEEYSGIYAESKRLRQNTLVNAFLNAEVGLACLIQEINRQIMSKVEFDDEFLS